MLQVALGGPGPVTLLFRQLHRSLQRPVIVVPFNSPWHLRHESTKSATLPRKKSLKPKARRQTTNDNKKNISTGQSPENLLDRPSSQPDAGNDVPMYLPPPPTAADIDRQIRKLRQGIGSDKPQLVLRAWAHMIDTQTTEAVSEEDYAGLSEFLVRQLSGGQLVTVNIGRLAVEDPERFGHMRHMAIESAARDKWQGLNSFLLELLGAGRPGDVISTFLSYKMRMRTVQDRDPSGLNSTLRAERIQARLVGEGILPLSMIYVAAQTLFDKFDSEAIMALLDTQADFRERRLKSFDFEVIRNKITGKGSSPSLRSILMGRFDKNIDKLILSTLCYHPVALSMRIDALAAAGNASVIDNIYRDIMRASIGRDKYIIPVDLSASNRYWNFIPLTEAVWFSFINAYEKGQKSSRIKDIIDYDMFERNVRPTPSLLAKAMQSYGFISCQRSAPLSERMKARKLSDELWQRLVDKGYNKLPEVLLRRLTVLIATNRTHDFEVLHNFGKSEILPAKAALLDRAMFAFLIRTRQVDKAMGLLADRIHGPNEDEEVTYQLFLRLALKSQLSFQDRRKILFQILTMKPADIQLRGDSLGMMLLFFLEGGHEIEKACQVIAKRLVSDLEPVNWWYNIVTTLLKRMPFPTALDIGAAVYILECLVPRDVTIRGSKVLTLWRSVIQAIALSNQVSSHERHTLIERCLDAFVHDPLYLELLKVYTAKQSLMREDAEGVPEAMFWWSQTRLHMVEDTSVWYQVVDRLVYHNHIQIAKDVIKDLSQRPAIRGSTRFFTYAAKQGLFPQSAIRNVADDTPEHIPALSPVSTVNEVDDEEASLDADTELIFHEDAMDEILRSDEST